ncbi:MAG: flagellar basal-body MS-ring/collar protein FliF [Xanthobacteraceae bacterium]
MQGLIQFVRTLGAARLAAMGAVTVAMIGFFVFLIMRVTAVPMVPLYTDLSFDDSSAIIKDLERQAISYEMKNDGAIIMVPQDKVARLRMKLAEGGLPKGGGVGYEIFDKSEALGTTSFVQNINRLRALEGELARTIRSLDRVQAARVHLVIPERPLFSRDKTEPSASIVVKTRGTLENQQVRAIRQLVASAVTGLKAQRVSVLDETGRLLADGTGDDGTMASAGSDERQLGLERRLREQIESIVSSVVGSGRARVNVNADFDFNRITQTSDKYDPEGRVLRSSQTREESSGSGDNQNAVTVGNELPNANAGGGQANQNRDQSKKSEEITNYEISRTTKTEVVEGGRINKIAVAVLVDGIYNKNDKGEVTYEERPKEQLDRIATLVRSAVGFDSKRGDQVEVVNLRFAETQAIPITEPTGFMSFLEFTKDDIMRGVEMLVMLLLGVVVVLLVVRPLVRRVITPDEGAVAQAVVANQAAQIAASTTVALPEPEPSAPGVSKTVKMIDIAQVKGQVHAQSVQKVGELADGNPNEAVSIIRQWLVEPEPA